MTTLKRLLLFLGLALLIAGGAYAVSLSSAAETAGDEQPRGNFEPMEGEVGGDFANGRPERPGTGSASSILGFAKTLLPMTLIILGVASAEWFNNFVKIRRRSARQKT